MALQSGRFYSIFKVKMNSGLNAIKQNDILYITFNFLLVEKNKNKKYILHKLNAP